MSSQAHSNIANISRGAALCGLFALLLSGASAAQTFTGSLSGPAEEPPNASPGTGFATITYDAAAHTLSVDVAFSGLVGTTTAAHIHCCTNSINPSTAGVATQVPTFSGFPAGVTAGSYQNTFDLTSAASFNPAFITANGGTAASAEAALVNGMLANRSYFNIHSSVFGGGEIRGFLNPAAALLRPAALIPTLDAWVIGLLAAVLFGAGLRYARKRRA